MKHINIDEISPNAFEQLLDEVRDQVEPIVVVMCECAFGNTPEELQLMGMRIKQIVNAGGIVHIIK